MRSLRPVSSATVLAQDAIRRRGKEAERRLMTSPKRRVLLVDDNDVPLSLRKVVLQTRGYLVVACIGGEAALAEFKKGGFDLVVSDLVMPDMDGEQLSDALKAIDKSTPVILG